MATQSKVIMTIDRFGNMVAQQVPEDLAERLSAAMREAGRPGHQDDDDRPVCRLIREAGTRAQDPPAPAPRNRAERRLLRRLGLRARRGQRAS
jgi:hypothetical protein